MKIFVSNFPFSTTEQDLTELFSLYGDIKSAQVVLDRDTQQSRGFGFVEFTRPDAAQAAIHNLNQTEWRGRTIKISEARPKEPRRQYAPRN